MPTAKEKTEATRVVPTGSAWPAIWCTAMAGACAGTRRELTAGADPNGLGDQGTTPLQVASVYGRMELVEVLLGGGADPNRADPHGNGPLWTAVHQACLASRTEANLASVRLLLAGGADPDHQNRYGLSPRAIATQRDDSVAALFPSAPK